MPLPPPLSFPSPPSLAQGSTCWLPRALCKGGWEGKEGWTGMVSDPGPCSSSLETGIIPSSEPSPHWLVSHLGFSFRLGPWHHGSSFPGIAASSLVVLLNCLSRGYVHWPEGISGPNTSIFLLSGKQLSKQRAPRNRNYACSKMFKHVFFLPSLAFNNKHLHIFAG